MRTRPHAPLACACTREIEAEFPHYGEIEIPGTGLGARLGAIHAWCNERVGRDNYALTHRHDRKAIGEWLQVRFRDKETAVAFRQAFPS